MEYNIRTAINPRITSRAALVIARDAMHWIAMWQQGKHRNRRGEPWWSPAMCCIVRNVGAHEGHPDTYRSANSSNYKSLRISIASAILPKLTHRIDNDAWTLRPANVIAPAA